MSIPSTIFYRFGGVLITFQYHVHGQATMSLWHKLSIVTLNTSENISVPAILCSLTWKHVVVFRPHLKGKKVTSDLQSCGVSHAWV